MADLRQPAAAEALSVLDLEIVAELRSLQSARNPNLLANLVDRFARDGSAQLVALRAAASAACVQDVDRLAHAFKGWSATLGAIQVATLCRELDALCDTGSIEGADALIERLELAHARAFEALRRELSPAP